MYKWSYLALIFIGVWLAINPLTFEYSSTSMYWNDIIVGVLVILFSLILIKRNYLVALWLIVLAGIWLQFAPLVFWAPDAMLYLNDTVCGVLLITFALLIPSSPENGQSIPPGWSYNPSSYLQRLPVVALACACWFFARYMAAYQLGYRDTVYDPIFDNGTLAVITSSVSQKFPVSDAGLGAAAYTIEALLGIHGGQSRWRTMPWIVLFFGLLVVPVGFASIILVMLQPILVGHWCFWCLLTALCMLLMIALTIDEVVATVQFLKSSKLPFWRTFWKGSDEVSQSAPAYTLSDMVRGVTPSWNLLLSAFLGILLMGLPQLLNMPKDFADLNYIAGALVFAISVISMAEVVRGFRFANGVLGVLIAFVMLMHADLFGFTTIANLVIAILLIGLCLPKGKIYNQ